MKLGTVGGRKQFINFQRGRRQGTATPSSRKGSNISASPAKKRAALGSRTAKATPARRRRLVQESDESDMEPIIEEEDE